MKTIQATTTNLIIYMEMNPKVKSRLLKEILPPVEAANQNISDCLTYETVMDFDYLQQCFYETMRIEPPVPLTTAQNMSRDVIINGIAFK